MEFNSGFKGLN